MHTQNQDPFTPDFVRQNLMGPSALRIIEELAETVPFEPGMRVLDLGCGKGLTSIYLVRRFGVTVFATDLWISPTENYERFAALGLDDRIIPIHAEAHALPYADGFFDRAISIDSYHYFGFEDDYLEKHLAPLVKPGGLIAVGVPGLREEFVSGVPEEMKPFYELEYHFHSCAWWRELWGKVGAVSVVDCAEMRCHKQAWEDWLACDNPYAQSDVKMMEVEGGKYFNTVKIVAQKKG